MVLYYAFCSHGCVVKQGQLGNLVPVPDLGLMMSVGGALPVCS